MKKNFFNFLFCSALFLVLTAVISCGGGGGSASLFMPENDLRNGGTGGWGGSHSTNSNREGNSTVVLSGGTSLDVEYYEYNGHRYTTAQELLEVLVQESITGTIEIPIHVRSDNSNRTAKYVVTANGPVLRHPYKITIKDKEGTTLFPTGAAGEPEYFYSSEGFPMNLLTNTGAQETICGTTFSFSSNSWAVTSASGSTVTVADNGSFSGSLMEGAEFTAKPVPAEKYTVDSSGNLGFSSLCTNGEEITIPAGTTSITQICIPADKQISIDLRNADYGNSSFSGVHTDCKDSITGIKLPETVTSIAAQAFDSCTNLTSVTIPDSVTSIDEKAFYECGNLTTINIPEDIITIGQRAFCNCKKLQNVELPENSSFTEIGNYAFYACEAFTNIEIPSNVTIIGESAFQGCKNLSSIIFNEGLQTIKLDAFNQCESLTVVNLPESLSSITTRGPFIGCTNLQTINFSPDSTITSIPSYFADNCPNLETVSLSNNISSINGHAFYRCPQLTTVTMPNSVTSIGESAFENSAINLTSLPTSIQTIGNKAFKDCTNLAISDATLLPASLTTVGNNAFENCTNCTFNIRTTITSIGQYAFAGSGVKKAQIAPSMTSIAEGAFKNCTNLIEVNLGSSTTTIDSYAFQGCTNLPSCSGINNVTTINSSAFYGCSNLGDITISGSLSFIGNLAFWDCDSMTSINFNFDPTTFTYNGINTFPTTPRLGKWTDPSGTAHTYSWGGDLSSYGWSEIF